VTALYLWLVRLNERHAARRLTDAKNQAERMFSEPPEDEVK